MFAHLREQLPFHGIVLLVEPIGNCAQDLSAGKILFAQDVFYALDVDEAPVPEDESEGLEL